MKIDKNLFKDQLISDKVFFLEEIIDSYNDISVSIKSISLEDIDSLNFTHKISENHYKYDYKYPRLLKM